ncbi:hypothetical protein DUNSADRAFT_2457 [Dunaliella salina]|uniref:Hint domain-containing protein n=1 Tax=Dunaliella salina TaxID=3046 RepID=A0ABQ7FW86_DUNSA|nr:hypothetical protein DUNSADRAFT_2457 [Dunaliella salina]|eukprot:KAF5826640.1 hypothetical protein DUNSADRAFT_2457 [Dunaliella salina]
MYLTASRPASPTQVDICWRGVGYPQFFGDVASHFATGDADYFTKGDSPGQKFACQHLAYWEAEVVTEDYQPPEEPEETDQLEEECFPASSIMWRRSPVPGSEFPTPVRMDSLRLGDDVMVLNREGKATWAPLLFMAHAYKDIPTVFVELRTISGRSIRASPDHLLMLSTTPKWDNVQALPAKDASIGMYVFSIAQPSKDTHADEKEGKGWRSFAAAVPVLITSVRKVKDTGLFAPVTTSPDAILVVDGFAAHELISMYSMRELSYLKWLVSFLQSLLGPMWFEALHSWLHSHAFTEVFNKIVLTLRYYMHSLVIKA